MTEKEVKKLVEKYFVNLNKKQKKAEVKKFTTSQKKPALKIKSKKNEQAHLILGFRGNPLGHKDKYIESVLSVILGNGMSSRLFIEVRERRGLAYSVRTSTEHYTDTGYIATYAGVDPKKAEEAVKVILDQHYGIRGELKISESELNKAKEYIKGHIALSLENTNAVNMFFGEQELLLGKVETPEDIFKGIDKVTIAECVRVAKELFRPEKLNLAIIGPYTSKAKFEKILK